MKKTVKSISLLLLLSVMLTACSAVKASPETGENGNGEIFSDEINLYASQSGDIDISEEDRLLLDGFEKTLKEKDALVDEIDEELKKEVLTPEEKLYKKELYDKKLKAMAEKYVLCIEYAQACIALSEKERELIAEPFAEYEKYFEEYKYRLSLEYEVGRPSKGDVFVTSDSLIDYISGSARLDEIKEYDSALKKKVDELYLLVADGLSNMKYFLTQSDLYDARAYNAKKHMDELADELTKYLPEILEDKDTYNYYLSYCASEHQKLKKELDERIKKYSVGLSGNTENYLWPTEEGLFYDDFVGKGHQYQYVWSALLGKYINIFHSGVDIYTSGRSAEIKACADGKVIYADYLPTRGYTVAVLHKGGTVTLYSHLSLINVFEGDNVKAGEALALSGVSGNADGEMLTLEFFREGEFTDPTDFVTMPDISLAEK